MTKENIKKDGKNTKTDLNEDEKSFLNNYFKNFDEKESNVTEKPSKSKYKNFEDLLNSLDPEDCTTEYVKIESDTSITAEQILEMDEKELAKYIKSHK